MALKSDQNHSPNAKEYNSATATFNILVGIMFLVAGIGIYLFLSGQITMCVSFPMILFGTGMGLIILKLINLRRSHMAKMVAQLGQGSFSEQKEAAKWLREIDWKPTTMEETCNFHAGLSEWEKCIMFGEPALQSLTLAVAEGEADESLQALHTIIAIYSQTKTQKAWSRILDANSSKHPEVKNWAAEQIKTSTSADELEVGLGSDDREVRTLAFSTLQKAFPEKTVEIISNVRQNLEKSIQLPAEKQMAAMNKLPLVFIQDWVPLVATLAKTADNKVRCQALEWMSHFKDNLIEETMIGIHFNESPSLDTLEIRSITTRYLENSTHPLYQSLKKKREDESKAVSKKIIENQLKNHNRYLHYTICQFIQSTKGREEFFPIFARLETIFSIAPELIADAGPFVRRETSKNHRVENSLYQTGKLREETEEMGVYLGKGGRDLVLKVYETINEKGKISALRYIWVDLMHPYHYEQDGQIIWDEEM